MPLLPFEVPAGLAEQARLGPDWAAWLERLPRRTAEVAEAWGVAWDLGEVRHGGTSLVVPVRTTDGAPAVLKVGFDGDDESAHEALALQHWAGRGAVRLLAADPRRRALLLERLSVRDLSDEGDLDACAVVADLWRDLDRPAPPQLLPVVAFVGRWADGCGRCPGTDAGRRSPRSRWPAPGGRVGCARGCGAVSTPSWTPATSRRIGPARGCWGGRIQD